MDQESIDGLPEPAWKHPVSGKPDYQHEVHKVKPMRSGPIPGLTILFFSKQKYTGRRSFIPNLGHIGPQLGPYWNSHKTSMAQRNWKELKKFLLLA